nr:ribonuclease H-like domain-containing protein [Tanacetum cinerariifolium]
MVTRSQVGTVKPNPHFNFHTSHIPPLSKSLSIALFDPNWLVAMYDQYNALVKNSTWILVSKPPNANVAPRAWFQWFASYALRVGFSSSRRDSHGTESKYAFKLLERAYMVSCNPSRTPIDTKSKLGPDEDPVLDSTLYSSMAGGLQYLTFTCPGISYAVQQICLYTHYPREPHLAALKLSAEAEYRGVANVVAKITWIYNLLWELHSPLLSATLVYCDNVSAIYLSANVVQHQRTKHIEIDIHFFRDMVTKS